MRRTVASCNAGGGVWSSRLRDGVAVIVRAGVTARQGAGRSGVHCAVPGVAAVTGGQRAGRTGPAMSGRYGSGGSCGGASWPGPAPPPIRTLRPIGREPCVMAAGCSEIGCLPLCDVVSPEADRGPIRAAVPLLVRPFQNRLSCRPWRRCRSPGPPLIVRCREITSRKGEGGSERVAPRQGRSAARLRKSLSLARVMAT